MAQGDNKRTLVIGATGFIGRFVAEASLATGRPTLVLVRSGATSTSKAKTIRALQEKGATILHVRVPNTSLQFLGLG